MKPKNIPDAGLTVLGRAVLTIGRKARPIVSDTQHQFISDALDQGHIAQYKRFFAFADNNDVPLTYYYLLSQRAQMAAMLDRAFTFPIPGVVHIANAMQLVDEACSASPFLIEVDVHQMPFLKGEKIFVEFDVRFKQGGITKILCSSRYLVRRGKSPAPPLNEDLSKFGERRTVANVVLQSDIGRRYARLSGDLNPIHLWPWSAKFLGFKQPIAHGMYLVGMTEASLKLEQNVPIKRIHVRFINPAVIPGDLEISKAHETFQLGQGNTLLAVGKYALN